MDNGTEHNGAERKGTERKGTELAPTAGAFDIRNVIGALLGIFGLILIVLGLVGFSPDEAERTGGIDANLWTGIGLIIAAIAFGLWAKLRPIRIVSDADSAGAAGVASDSADDDGPLPNP